MITANTTNMQMPITNSINIAHIYSAQPDGVHMG